MSKVRVPIAGTVGKAVMFDPQAGARAEAAVAALRAQISAGVGGTIRHSSLLGLQVGDDHPQYAMWQAPETIQGLWNFQTIPLIQGETLAEYIEEVVGGSFFDFLQDTSSVVWTYFDTAGQLEANVPPEFVQDTVGAMLTDSTSIDFTYSDLAGTITAATINANPTATIGLTAVNGSAATPMRSDAAPALSQAITPTWTNTHTFNNTPVVPNDSWTYAKIQNVSATNRVLGRISSGAGDIEELTGADLLTILSAAGLSAANPTASVGLSAVNGSATTYMRSDAAPALDQAIAPTMTGIWTFSGTASTAAPRVIFTGSFVNNEFDESDASANNRRWHITVNNAQFLMRAVNDARNSAADFLTVDRSGASITAVTLGSPFGQFDNNATANNTRLLLWDVTAGALVRVSRGATDSGGTGFRVLRIPN